MRLLVLPDATGRAIGRLTDRCARGRGNRRIYAPAPCAGLAGGRAAYRARGLAETDL